MKKMVSLLTLALVSLSFVFSADVAFAKKKKKKKKKKAKMEMSQTWERGYGLAGCGLGALALGAEGNQILASTTNGTAYNNLFGITFGTSECVDGPMADTAHKMDNFIQVNKVALASDIARGQGESINTISALMGCSDASLLGATLKDNFEAIYPEHEVQTMDITDSVINVILENQDLKQSCQTIG